MTTLERFVQNAHALARQWLGQAAQADADAEVMAGALTLHAGLAPARALVAGDESARGGCDPRAWQALARLDPDTAMLADTMGQRRPAWLWLVLHLHLAAMSAAAQPSSGATPVPAGLLKRLSRWIGALRGDAERAQQGGAGLWAALLGVEAAALGGEHDLAAAAHELAQDLLDRPGRGGALHPQQPEESLDGWIFAELIGLHALADLAAIADPTRRARYSRRLIEAAGYHLEYTQPDNVTTHPWGALAFALDPVAWTLAEQQLHDTTFGIGNSPGASATAALAPALLLADIAHFGHLHLAGVFQSPYASHDAGEARHG